MNAVDTNVLIYAHDPRDPEKQAIAVSLIESLADAVLLWQVACEYVSVSKKLEPFGYSREQAWQDVQELRLVWDAVLPSWDVADRAQQLLDRIQPVILGCNDSGGVSGGWGCKDILRELFGIRPNRRFGNREPVCANPVIAVGLVVTEGKTHESAFQCFRRIALCCDCCRGTGRRA